MTCDLTIHGVTHIDVEIKRFPQCSATEAFVVKRFLIVDHDGNRFEVSCYMAAHAEEHQSGNVMNIKNWK